LNKVPKPGFNVKNSFMKTYDAIVIGTGQAAPALVSRLAAEGKQVAVIEKGHFGGTCVNDGCTPTKAYVASARRAFIAQNSLEHGIQLKEEVSIDLSKIKARKDKLVSESREGIEEMLREMDGVDVFIGHGRFTGSHTISVNDETLKAEQIFLNVGGRARKLDDFKDVEYLINTSILELTEVPEHLIIVGGGYIGLEFAQMFKRFGSKVTLIEMSDKLLKRADNDVSEAINNIFEKSGVEVRLKAECLSGKTRADGQISVQLDCDEDDKEIVGSHVLLAVGRLPNTDDLGLGKAGVELNDHGYIQVNEHLQSNQTHIFALGDCNGEGAFTHTAYNDFQIVASYLFDGGKRKLSDRIMAYASYIDPPLAHVGMSEKEVKEKGIKAKIAKREMSRIARAKEMGETQGFLKMLIDSETDKFLGATFLGIGADEYIHSVLDLMYADAPYTAMRDAMHIHPTVSELLPTMLESLEELE
jgi:pyruvate/2-oxoglutarate dehydrogenase complex dihydrolipoamide dehydrogenase (E3) component